MTKDRLIKAIKREHLASDQCDGNGNYIISTADLCTLRHHLFHVMANLAEGATVEDTVDALHHIQDIESSSDAIFSAIDRILDAVE